MAPTDEDVPGVGERNAQSRGSRPEAMVDEVLRRYVGQRIGMNWDKAHEFKPIYLLDVSPGVVTVSVGPGQPIFHYATAFILSAAEGEFPLGRTGKTTVPLLVQLSAWPRP
ncbi:MAG: hypothetical protein U0869_00140 [Chloroflexota bacterium]